MKRLIAFGVTFLVTLPCAALFAQAEAPKPEEGAQPAPEPLTENQQIAQRLKVQFQRQFDGQLRALQQMRVRVFRELDRTLGATPNPGGDNWNVPETTQDPMQRLRERFGGGPGGPDGGGGINDMLQGLMDQLGGGQAPDRIRELMDQFGGNIPGLPGGQPEPAPGAAPQPTPGEAPKPIEEGQAPNENLDQFFNRMFGPAPSDAPKTDAPKTDAPKTDQPARSGQPGRLGFSARDLSAEEASLLGLEGTAVQVDNVAEGSAAKEGGLEAGDVIETISGKKVGGLDALRGLAGEIQAGDKVKVVVLRNGAKKVLTLTAKPR